MKLSMPQASAERASIGALSVGEVRLGPARIGRLSWRGARIDASASRAELRDVTLRLGLQFALRWAVGWHIDVPEPWPDLDLREHGTLDLGRIDLPIRLGHLSLPGLRQLPLTVPAGTADDVQAVFGALGALQLGPALAEQVKLRGVQLPSAGLSLQGLGVQAAHLAGVSVPGAAVQQVQVGRLWTGSRPVDALRLQGLQLPPVRLDPLHLSVQGAQPDPVVAELAPADNGLLSATLRLTATASLEVGDLAITGLKAGVGLDELVLQDVELPVELLDLTLSQLGIGEIAVPDMALR